MPLLRWMVLVLAVSPTAIARAQTAQPSEAPQAQVALTKLAPPVYSPAAWQAHIMGEVKIILAVGKDGSLVSSELVSGHPLLAKAALDSVRKSEFQCLDCSGETTKYTLTFSFEFRDRRGCPTESQGEPTVKVSADKVTVTIPPKCIVIEQN